MSKHDLWFRPLGGHEEDVRRDLFIHSRVAVGFFLDEAERYAFKREQDDLTRHDIYKLAAVAGDSIVGVLVAYKDTVQLSDHPHIANGVQEIMGDSFGRERYEGSATFAHVAELSVAPELHGEGIGPQLAIVGLKNLRERYNTQLLKFRVTEASSQVLFDGNPKAYGFAETQSGLSGAADGPQFVRSEHVGLIDNGIAAMHASLANRQQLPV